jgi:hypothetical protein
LWRADIGNGGERACASAKGGRLYVLKLWVVGDVGVGVTRVCRHFQVIERGTGSQPLSNGGKVMKIVDDAALGADLEGRNGAHCP